MAQTKYIVLKKHGAAWEEEIRVDAASAKAAIQAAMATQSEGGEFVAVPARSWQPVKVEVTAALKFS